MKSKFWNFSFLLLFAISTPILAQNIQIDPEVYNKINTNGNQDVLIILDNTVDLSQALSIDEKTEKGYFVYQSLRAHAEESQKAVIQYLNEKQIAFKSYFLANAILTNLDAESLEDLSDFSSVRRIQVDEWAKNELPKDEAIQSVEDRTIDAVEWGIAMIRADEVWDLGFKGADVVIGGQDTGVEWDHPAIKAQYRGWDGSNEDHNYNWHDAIHEINSSNSGSNPCGLNNIAPCDDHNHGTHTVGTMVGEDNNLQIGVAPEASWIGCRNMERGDGKPSTYLECFEWFLAPTDSNNENPDVSKAPHVINNSWGCPESEGCNPNNFAILEIAINNLKSAGVVVVASAGNSGSDCSTISNPPAIYENSFAVGATNENDMITGFSSRGPVTVDNSNRLKPNVSAPGRNVLSCIKNGQYAAYNGTSMAGPHVAGAVALIISARPALAGKVDLIEDILEQSAVSKSTSQDCGDVDGSSIPNNTYGYGRIDVMEAVDMALNIDITNTKQVSNQDIEVYPNPTQGKVYFNLKQDLSNAVIRIFNADGTVLITESLNSNMHSVDLGNFPKGLFIYHIQADDLNLSGRIVLNK
jgi:serine protease AprX